MKRKRKKEMTSTLSESDRELSLLQSEKDPCSLRKLQYHQSVLIQRRLDETGGRERLMNYLRAKLLSCGWNENAKDLCKEAIQSKKGLGNVNLEQVVSDVLVEAKNLIPEEIKAMFLQRLILSIEQDKKTQNILSAPPEDAATSV